MDRSADTLQQPMTPAPGRRNTAFMHRNCCKALVICNLRHVHAWPSALSAQDQHLLGPRMSS